MCQRTAEPVELPGHQQDGSRGGGQRRVEARTISSRARESLILQDSPVASARQRGALVGGVLVIGGHAGVADRRGPF